MAKTSKNRTARNVPRPKQEDISGRPVQKELRIDLPLAGVLALGPFGYQVLELPNAPIVGVVSWAICLVLIGRIAWVLAGNVNTRLRYVIALGLLLLGSVLWMPIRGHIAKTLEQPKARVEVTRILASPAYKTEGKEFFVNVYYANHGSLPAKGLLDHGMIKLTDRGLSSSELNDIAVDLLNDQHGTPNYKDEIQPGAPDLWFTDRHPYLSGSDISAITEGNKALYIIHVIRYKDSSMANTEEGVTEFCEYYSGSFSIAKTCGNNRIYKRTVPKKSSL